MKTNLKAALLSLLSVWTIVLAAAACESETRPSNTTWEAPSGRNPDASVNGSVTYRERLALTPGAMLVVELRDVSYADAPAPLIARQTITGPGQVPIKFEVGYNRQDINPRNSYSVSARIVESDGRLAFINDTAYDVITRGRPNKVAMLLVLVQPPPGLVGNGGAAGSDWRTWVEVPAPVLWASLMPNEAEHLLRVVYHQSTIEGCARPGSQELELDGYDIIVRVTLMQPPPTPWAIPCHEQVVELDTVAPVGEPLELGQTYRVRVNGRETTSFTLPALGLRYTFIAESPIERAEVLVAGAPSQYQLRVVSAMPKGSSCSQFNGYEIRRIASNRIDVAITHHQVADPLVPCTADYPVVETSVPLGSVGSDFEPGVEYTVRVNADTTRSFVAR